MGFLLYDLYFDIAWHCDGCSACPHCVCSDFNIFPRPFKPSMCPLHPFKAPIFL